MLERAGYRVETAADGDEGLQVYRDRAADIDLVLLDVVMPRKGAEEVLPVLLETRPDLPVILTSGDALPESLEVALEPSGGRFLHKPFAPRALLRLLAELEGSAGTTASGGD